MTYQFQINSNQKNQAYSICIMIIIANILNPLNEDALNSQSKSPIANLVFLAPDEGQIGAISIRLTPTLIYFSVSKCFFFYSEGLRSLPCSLQYSLRIKPITFLFLKL